MRADRYYMLSFDSTHAALFAQRRFQGRLAMSVMPTLRAVQAGCGISLRVEEEHFETLKELLPELDKESWRLYLIEGMAAPKATALELAEPPEGEAGTQHL